MRLRALAGLASSILSPALCAACDSEVHGRAVFCAACEPSLLPVTDAGTHVAAFEYGGAIGRAITRYKYEGQPWLGVPLGSLAATALVRLSRPFDLVTHVPLHATRLADRGFDQSALLAREVARIANRSLQYALIVRVRRTEQQARMGRAARLRNVADAFVANGRKIPLFRGQRVLLVDDVRTTGATLSACMHALREAGAAEVQTLVLAQDT
jgi:ComF family protein